MAPKIIDLNSSRYKKSTDRRPQILNSAPIPKSLKGKISGHASIKFYRML